LPPGEISELPNLLGIKMLNYFHRGKGIHQAGISIPPMTYSCQYLYKD